jgi:predicted adenylyl cyclase CyaB
MKLRNYEFKARVKDLDNLELKLLELRPFFKGEDHQVDTYFNAGSGRLKIREGNIENALIFYERPDVPDSKQSDILIYNNKPLGQLREILLKAIGVKVTVSKYRKIYYIENVKFHFDTVENLGDFIEVEVLDESGSIPVEQLKEQCNFYFEYFGLKHSDLQDRSYSDMLSDDNL